MKLLTMKQCHEINGGISSDLAMLGAIVTGAGMLGAVEGAALSYAGVSPYGIRTAATIAGVTASALTMFIASPASFLEPARFWGMVKKDLLG